MPPGDERPQTPTYQTPEAKLARNVREICRRVVRGKAAASNPSVRWHLVLRIAAIMLSSLGSVGVIADKASGSLPQETGWAFWGSVILLAFGILSQIANELQVAQRAAASRSLSDQCKLCEIQLENILVVDDPRVPAGKLLDSVGDVFEKEDHARVLPDLTSDMENEALRMADRLLAFHGPHWELPPLPAGPKSVRRTRRGNPPLPPEPPKGAADESR